MTIISFLVLGDSKTWCSSIRSVRSALEGTGSVLPLIAWTEPLLDEMEEGILEGEEDFFMGVLVSTGSFPL